MFFLLNIARLQSGYVERLEGEQLGWAKTSIQKLYRCIFHYLSTCEEMRANMARYPRVLMESCCKVAGCLPNIAGIASRTFNLVYNRAHEGFRNLWFQRRQRCLHFPHCEYDWNFSHFLEVLASWSLVCSLNCRMSGGILLTVWSLLHLLTGFSTVDNSYPRQRLTIG